MSQVLTARAVAMDMGDSRAASTGVDRWASCHIRNSERDVQRTIGKQKTKLDIDVKTVCCNGIDIPWISPQQWLQFIVKKGLWPRLAGCDLHDYDGARRNFSEFWKAYEIINPTFELFQIPGIDLSRTAPFLVHGDEGRTLKKGGLMVTLVQCCLGKGFDDKRVRGQGSDSAKLRVNFAGHTFTNRYVVSVVPKISYESDPELFHDMVEHIAKSLNKCFREGYVDESRKETFRIVVLGVKGDAPYLSKVAHFYRSYNTTTKRGEERGPPKGICPYCLAGTRAFPAEEIATSNPQWLATVGIKLPWVRQPALIQHLIHDRGDPASFFKTDIWHVFHLGFGRSWIASVLQLVLQVLPCQNLDLKWEYLTDSYLNWCKANHRQSHVSKITAYLMSYGDTSGAMGSWHKGALTTNLMGWLVDLLGSVPSDPQNRLVQCRGATYRINAMFRVLYRSGAFLGESEALFVAEQGLSFLQCYASMASSLYQEGKQWCFPLYPKLHQFHHLLLETRFLAISVKLAPNVMMWSCQLDEDIVGRTSKLSRRVNIRKVAQRSLDRFLVAAHTAHVKERLLS